MKNNTEQLIGAIKNPDPSILYHYTSQKGLLEIVNSKTIWATNIYYLNDSLEYEYAVKLIQEVIDEYLAPLPPVRTPGRGLPSSGDKDDLESIKRILLESAKQMLSAFTSSCHVYVCSFSEEGDQLSQWRGYCPNGNGFSVGFGTSHLIAQMAKSSLDLVQCIYNKSEQVEIVKNIIDKLISDLELDAGKSADIKKDFLVEALSKIIPQSVGNLLSIMPRLKHETFHEEKEWRFVNIFFGSEPVHFREGKSMIIPHIVIPLAENEEPNKIDRIIIGPTPHQQLAQKAVQLLMESNKIKCEVELSKTPYRTW
jgi:hypothetical protein